MRIEIDGDLIDVDVSLNTERIAELLVGATSIPRKLILEIGPRRARRLVSLLSGLWAERKDKE